MTKLLHLNLGAGFNKIDLPSWINVDCEPSTKPDVLHNLEIFPWPFESNSTEEVLLNHVLEHINNFKGFIQELFRVCIPGAFIHIAVPFFRHENAVADFTHCRVVTQLGLSLLSKKNNEMWIKAHVANSPLALVWNVNFELTSLFYVSDPAVWQKVFPTMLQDDARYQKKLHENAYINNLVSEIRAVLKVVK